MEKTGSRASNKIISAVQLRHITDFTAVVLTTRGTYSDLPAAYARLTTWAEGIDVFPTANPLGIIYGRDAMVQGHSFRFSLCLPTSKPEAERARAAVASPVREGEGRPALLTDDVVEVRGFPRILAAVAFYRGPAAGLAEVYDSVSAWVEERPYMSSGAAREVYLAEPGLPAHDQVELEVHQPVLPSKR